MVLATTLMLATLADGALAADPAIALEINAIPGVAIDICDDGMEVHSDQPYSWRNIWGPIDPPTQTWTIHRAAAGECTGPILGDFEATFEPGKNYSVVYWRRGKNVRMTIFEAHHHVGRAGRVTLQLHHIAKTRSVGARIRQWLAGGARRIRSVSGLANTEVVSLVLPARSIAVKVFPEEPSVRWSAAHGHIDAVEAGGSYQAFFMGSRRGNMTVAIWPIAALPPAVTDPAGGGRRSPSPRRTP